MGKPGPKWAAPFSIIRPIDNGHKYSYYGRGNYLKIKVKIMEERYSIANAKNKLPSLIHSVEAGRPVKLTRHGKPVAVLLSIKDYERMNREKTGYWRSLNSWRKRTEDEGIVFTGEDFEGLRDNSPGREVELP
jgi:prevent-host-death family protein